MFFIRVFQIYPDPSSSMEVESSLVRCPHHKPAVSPGGPTTPGGCRWVGAVSQLAGHLATCRYDSLPCPKECGARLSRMCLQDHLQYTCPARRVVCGSCQKEFSGEAMEVREWEGEGWGKESGVGGREREGE